MLDSIYNILSFVPIVLAFIYLIPCTIVLIKKDYYNVKNIKTRIMLASIICILYILRIILSMALQKSGFLFGSNVFCAIIWALNIVLVYSNLKRAQDTHDFEVYITLEPYCDDSKVVESNEYEVIETNEESCKITHFGSNK